MICASCDGVGLIPFVMADNPTPDDAITADELQFAVCLCAKGQTMRSRNNTGRKVAPLWVVWCARERVNPARVWMAEDVYTPAQLAACGLVVQQGQAFREARMLAAGKSKR